LADAQTLNWFIPRVYVFDFNMKFIDKDNYMRENKAFSRRGEENAKKNQ